MTGIIVLMITCGMISAAFAAEKRRSAVGWFVIGALFPVLGTILAIVLPANPEPGTNV
ncbi:MAG: hypothetical protein JWO36_931 [Myxococcales bacterium]|nr:hypothetical protein [Myxococcales bacterium]